MKNFNTVKGSISKLFNFRANAIKLGTDFDNDLGLDSLDKMELIGHIEKEFNIVFSDDQIMSMRTVGDMVRYVNMNRLEQKGNKSVFLYRLRASLMNKKTR